MSPADDVKAPIRHADRFFIGGEVERPMPVPCPVAFALVSCARLGWLRSPWLAALASVG
jgi:hypothetical protein